MAALVPTSMPDTTFGLTPGSLRLRYHPEPKLRQSSFDGEGMMPIDKDAIAQFIGFMGELNNGKSAIQLEYADSNPAAKPE